MITNILIYFRLSFQLLSELSFRCPDVCDCPSSPSQCQDGVPLVLDGCGCCMVCARQQGDVCNSIQVCDATRKLQCTYADPFSATGICRGKEKNKCKVLLHVYVKGKTSFIMKYMDIFRGKCY